jgi:hypothetical protein
MSSERPGVTDDRLLRSQLVDLLRGEGARMAFDDAVADFPADAINRIIPNGTVTPWHMLEHIRLTQWDILDYIRNRDYVEPDWPAEYWPPVDARATPEQFQATLDAFRADNDALRQIVRDTATDVFATIPNTPGHTIIREVRIVADHNSYHLGEFAILRQAMGTWPASRRG